MALLREEGVAFLPHGLAATIAEFRKHVGLEMLATSILMLLVLVPLIALKEFRRRNLV